ncbi:DUF4159 domain-containing protein [Paludisphaera borealis]|uniref:DUF4159 domain-containing protein n=1 Tax=Paludisphaera borealis TaxID=1387353 RepID=A0A1U7CY02_9BACT|nr:hypothetical protein BSF38_05404 [Paludisphaera borealis]
MTRKRLRLAVVSCVLAVAGGVALAQQRGGRGWRWGGGGSPLDGLPADRSGVPDWKVDERFKNDVFTFVRVQYDSDFSNFYGGGGRGGRRGWGGGGTWTTDWPDSDLNFSYRLQQLTSLKVNPKPITLRLTDEKLFDYPFLYFIEVAGLSFSEEEAAALRRYLLNGGFMMVDDFWGEAAYQNFADQMKRVFPDREPVELPITHEIFQCVYRLKEKPQVPSIHSWYPGSDVTWEDHGPGSREVHYKGISDDKGRLMAIICHNTDLGDGWEREGEDPSYFKEFSEKKSYPMGINIVTYAMTH